MNIESKHAQRIKTICNFTFNRKKVLKHDLLWDYHRFPSNALAKCAIGYTIEVFAPHKCS